MEGAVRGDLCTFMIISRRILRRIKVSDNRYRENKTHSSVTFPFENRDIYEIVWKNMVEADRT
jgi:hypothetical protein